MLQAVKIYRTKYSGPKFVHQLYVVQPENQVFLNGSETSETLLQSELYVAKLSLKCRYLFGNFCKFLAPKTKTVNKNIVMKVNFLKKLSI